MRNYVKFYILIEKSDKKNSLYKRNGELWGNYINFLICTIAVKSRTNHKKEQYWLQIVFVFYNRLRRRQRLCLRTVTRMMSLSPYPSIITTITITTIMWRSLKPSSTRPSSTQPTASYSKQSPPSNILRRLTRQSIQCKPNPQPHPKGSPDLSLVTKVLAPRPPHQCPLRPPLPLHCPHCPNHHRHRQRSKLRRSPLHRRPRRSKVTAKRGRHRNWKTRLTRHHQMLGTRQLRARLRENRMGLANRGLH